MTTFTPVARSRTSAGGRTDGEPSTNFGAICRREGTRCWAAAILGRYALVRQARGDVPALGESPKSGGKWPVALSPEETLMCRLLSGYRQSPVRMLAAFEQPEVET
jgi:hypothetical protein